MPELSQEEVLRRSLRGFRPPFSDEEADAIIPRVDIETWVPDFARNNVYVYFSFEYDESVWALNVNLVFHEATGEWIPFYDGEGPDGAYFDLDEDTGKFAIYGL